MKRLTLFMLVIVLLGLGITAVALAFNDDPEGGGPRCYWTWDHRFVCGP